MKKEILKFQNVYTKNAARYDLEHVSFCLMEDDIVGLIGLAESGKDILTKILKGEQTVREGFISIRGRKILLTEELARKVYVMNPLNYKIGKWTVAEYVSFQSEHAGWGYYKKNRIFEKTKKIFEQLHLDIGVERTINELSAIEKRQIDIVKAVLNGADIVVIEDDFEEMSREDIISLRHTFKNLIQGKMTIIINNYSEVATGLLADKFIIWKKGKIVKKCRREYIKDSKHLEKFLMGETIRSKKESLDRMDMEHLPNREEIYRICGFAVGERQMDLRFYKGNITTILSRNIKVKERIFSLLSGRSQEEISRYFKGELKDYHDISAYVEDKIVSVAYPGEGKELFSHMTVTENIVLPSMEKLSFWEYIFSGGNLKKMLANEEGLAGLEMEEQARTLQSNEGITVSMERWKIFNPSVIILMEPFAHCDNYGVAIVKSYIKKFASKGAAVIVIKSREENLEDITDEFIKI